jgi:threonine dehydrogenase-like Zn-dependent dehydrogenase
MKAVCWHGKHDVRVDSVPDPSIRDPRDAIIEVTATAICGSDLHFYDGFVPSMKSGDVVGHEAMGRVVEVGSMVRRVKKGDRVVVPFTISCGTCFFCQKGLFSLCDDSNPNAEEARQAMGHSPAGMFGYSHMLGGFPGGQAEYLRVPYADVGPIVVPDEVSDEQALFLSDIFPTGYMAAENCGIEAGDTVAVWGCGPVAQFAIRSAWMFGAERVIAIDRVPDRLAMAAGEGRAETIDYSKHDVYTQLMELTNGRGPDRCIDAVGAEAHAASPMTVAFDKAKNALRVGTDRPYALNEAIRSCRKGGTLSIPGVYVGNVNLLFGAAMNKGLTMKMGQTHVQRYLEPLLERIRSGEIDPSFVITHRLPLEDAPAAYRTFRDKTDGCIKVVMLPHG